MAGMERQQLQSSEQRRWGEADRGGHANNIENTVKAFVTIDITRKIRSWSTCSICGKSMLTRHSSTRASHKMVFSPGGMFSVKASVLKTRVMSKECWLDHQERRKPCPPPTYTLHEFP